MRFRRRPQLPGTYDAARASMVQMFTEISENLVGLSEGRIEVTNGLTAAPTTGKWQAGDWMRNTAPTELGSAPDTYIIWGWVCVASGEPGTWEALVIGTDTGSVGSGAGKHAVSIIAGSMSPSATGGCADLAIVATSADRPDLSTLDFDATTQEYAQFSFPMPKSWNEGTVTFKAYWSHPATTTNFGVVWGLQAVAVSNDDAIAAAYGTAQEVTDTGGTTDDLYVTSESSAITIAGTPAAEDLVFFRVYRKPSDGGDTLAVDARLHGVVVFMTTHAATDA